jgi:signal transduction histidine kinase
MLYNYVVYRVLKQRFLVHYLGVMFTVGLWGACVHGYLDYWFGGGWQFSPRLGFFNYIALIAGTGFTRSFLMTARLMPLTDYYHKMVMAVCLVGALVSLTPLDAITGPYVGPGLDILSLFQTLMIWGCAWWCLRVGFWPARFFILAWFLSMVGVVLTCLGLLGYLSQDYLIRFSLQIASAGEMLIFAIAVGDRFRKMQQEKLEAARASWQSHRLKTLVDMACHDISSPMAVIQMQAEMAKAGSGDLSQNTLGTIQRAVKQQASIINYIRREHLRVDDNPGSSQLTGVSLAEVVTELEFLFSTRAKRKGVKLNFPDGDQVQGLQVAADGVALIHSVLGNLVSNAIKFTPRGKSVTLSVLRVSPGHLAIQVRDEGVGIPTAELAMIESGSWGASVRRKGTDGEEGSGIGLSLVRSLAESFGGALQLESSIASTPDGASGTIATVTLVQVQAGTISAESGALTQGPVAR